MKRSKKHGSSAEHPKFRVEDLPYRPCVGVVLINSQGLVFVGRRKKEAGPEHVDDRHSWQMPQGGIPQHAGGRDGQYAKRRRANEELARFDDAPLAAASIASLRSLSISAAANPP